MCIRDRSWSTSTSSGTFWSSVTRRLEMRAISALSIRLWRRLSCLISPARLSSVSRSPYSPINGEYGDLETLLKRAGEIKQDKRRQSLIDNAEIARISKRLVTLDQNVPLDVPVDQLAVHEPDYKHLIAFLKAMEFNTITRRVAEKAEIDASQVEADAKLVSGAPSPARSAPVGKTGDLFAPPPQAKPSAKSETNGVLTPISLAAARAEAAREQKIDRSKYECVRTLARPVSYTHLTLPTN